MGLVNATNPTPYATAATGAGQAAFGSANTINQQQQAASFGNIAGGILGSAATMGLNMVAPGLGSAVGMATGMGGGGGGWIGGLGAGNESTTSGSGSELQNIPGYNITSMTGI